MRSVGADRFEGVLEIVGDEIEAHKEEEDGHCESGKDFCALQAERMADGGSFPHLEVAEYVN